MNEIWKDVVGFEGLYQISNKGNVRSITRYKKILTPCIDKDGYRCVQLKHKGISKHCRINRLVATAFIPNPKEKAIVNHIDMNRANDCVTNLEWCSAKENVEWSLKHGKYKGSNHKKVIQLNMNGEKLDRYESISEASRKTKIQISNISYCLSGKRKTAGGYLWKHEI